MLCSTLFLLPEAFAGVSMNSDEQIIKDKHPGGRPRKINSPEELFEMFQGYKIWAHENPWLREDFIKSGESAGQKVYLETERPLTEMGFAVHLEMSRDGLREYAKREEYSYIYARIKDEMSEQKISGGLAGAYNPMLVSRIEGLVEKTDINHSGEVSLADSLAAARKRANVE